MKLQACPKCGAKFDVSAFARGQQFSCGACGQVIVAHQDAPAAAVAGRAPGSRGAAPSAAPSAAGRAPAAPAGRTPGGAAPRGPQYKPVERHQDPRAAAAPSREAPSRERSGRDTQGSRREKKKGPPIALFAIAGLVVAGVIVFLVVGSGSGSSTPTPGGGNTVAQGPGGTGPGAGGTGPGGATPGSGGPASPPAESYDSLVQQVKEKPPKTAVAMKLMAKKFLAVGTPGAQTEAKALYRQVVEKADPNDAEAHKFLGDQEFHHELPEAIAFMKYPFLDAVQTANGQRWFSDPEAFKIAEAAWKETQEHARKLETDQEYRAADQARANIAQDVIFKDYNYTTIWARPYLICYSSSDRLSPYDLLSEKDPEKRKQKLAEMAEKQKKWELVLKEKARIFTQLYAEWMKRFSGPLELKDLMAPYGGREDYPQGVRSFQDGCPLVIWIFTDHKAFLEHHNKVVPEKERGIHPGIAGYFSPTTGWVYLFNTDDEDRQREIDTNVHEGTHQLDHWFTRQRNRWRRPQRGQSFFGEGLAEWIGSVKVDKKRGVTFTGVNHGRLQEMQSFAKELPKQKQEYRFYPLEKLVGFTSYGDAQQYANEQWKMDPFVGLLLFYEQAYSLVYWLNDIEGAKYREPFNQFFAGVLSNQPVAESFKKAFKIRDEDDWLALDEAYVKYAKGTLIPLKLDQYKYTPPGREDWEAADK